MINKKGVSSLIILAGGFIILGILVAVGVKVGAAYACGVLNNNRQALLMEFMDMLFYSSTIEDGVIKFDMPSTYTISIDNNYITLKLSSNICAMLEKDIGYAKTTKPYSLHISPITLTGSSFCLKKKNNHLSLCLEGEECCEE